MSKRIILIINIFFLHGASFFLFAQGKSLFPIIGSNTYADVQGKKIASVQIVGAKKISASQIIEVLDINQGFFKDKFDVKQFEQGLLRLRNLYREKGFVDFEILSTEVKKKTVRNDLFIMVVLYEGKNVLIKDIQIIGLPDEVKKIENKKENSEIGLAQKLLNQLTIKIKDPYNPDLLFVNEALIANEFLLNGFRKVNVTHKIDLQNDEARIQFMVQAGEQWFIHQVHHRGNKNVHTYAVLNEIILTPGEIYDPRKIKTSVDNLYATALFRSVQVREEEISKNKVSIHFTLEEGTHQNIGFGVGYLTDQKWYGVVRWMTRNAFYQGANLSSDFSYSEIKQEGNITYYQRNFLIKKMYYQTRPYWRQEKIEESDMEPFRLALVGLENIWSYRFNNWLSATLGLDYRHYYFISIGDEDFFYSDTSAVLNIYNFHILNEYVIKQSWIIDTRDNYLDSTRGLFTSIAFGFHDKISYYEYSFWQVNYNFSVYFPLFWGFVFAPQIAIGQQFTVLAGNTSLLIDRMAQGVDFTMRGYKYRNFGPINAKGNFIGGDRFYFASIELRFPYIYILQFVLFMDYGNLFLREWKWGEYEKTPGIGLRVRTPVGPIRFDLGFSMEQEKWWNKYNFSFGLGQKF